MHNVAKLLPFPLLASLLVACSGATEPDPGPIEGEASLALEPANEATVDKGRRGDEERGHRGRRHHRRGHRPTPPPPEPAGESCEVAGQVFPDGGAVPSGDSCNTCGCSDGSVNCTLALCAPVACAAFIEAPDGACSRLPLDPCIAQDPDCAPEGAACEVAGQTFADGTEVPSGDSCNTCNCADGNVACTRAFCGPQICALFIEAPDGVCSRFPLDPCIAQDPDCVPSESSCEVAGETFESGSPVPSGDSCNTCSCNDGGVICTLALCEPVACALFVEAPDGVCSRFPLDPCISQDPDCIDPEQPSEPTDPVEPAQP